MALPAHKARQIAQSCGPEYEILAAGVARLLVASPDPSNWTHTGLTGACVFIFNRSADHHLLRLYGLATHDLLWEFELYEDFRMQFVSDRLLAFEVDDFVMGLAFSLTSDAEEFFTAVQDEAPRSADSLQLIMFRDLENKQRLQRGGGLTRLFGWRKADASKAGSGASADAGALEEALQSAQGVEIVLNADGTIDVASLSPALRLVFKRAGIRKRDLRHRSTAAMLLSVLQEVGADISEAEAQRTSPAVTTAAPSLAAFTIQEEQDGEEEEEEEGGGGEQDEEVGGEADDTPKSMPGIQQPAGDGSGRSSTSTSSIQAPPALLSSAARPPVQLPPPQSSAAGPIESSTSTSPSPRSRTKRSSMAAFKSPAVSTPTPPLASPATPTPPVVPAASSTPPSATSGGGSSSASPRARRMSRRMVSAVSSAAASRHASMAAVTEESGDEGGQGGAPSSHPGQDGQRGDAAQTVRPSLSGAIAAAAKAREDRAGKGGGGRLAQSLPSAPRPAGSSLLDQIKAKGAGGIKGGLRHVRRPTDARKSIVAKFAKQPAAGPGLLGQLQANLAHRRMFLKEESSDEDDSDSEWSD